MAKKKQPKQHYDVIRPGRTTKDATLPSVENKSPKKPKRRPKKKLKPAYLQQWHRQLVRHTRPLSFVAGVLIVAIWTVYRHITNGVNFDVVGQIGLADQWVHGLHDGVQLGTTSYLFKIPLYILANLTGLSPMNRILLLALLCNLATFALLFLLYERIMKLFHVTQRTWLYLAFVWLATIAGNVYWMDYANSRNLETVGGVWLVYLVLQFVKTQRLKTLLWLGLAEALVFFVDPLQWYVVGLGICLFAAGRIVVKQSRRETQLSLNLILMTIVGYVGSLGLLLVAKKVLLVSFLQAPKQSIPLTPHSLITTLQAVLSNTFAVFGADFWRHPYGINTVRELLNAAIVVSFVVVVVRLLHKKPRRVAYLLVGSCIVMNYIVYVLSGQALQWATSRYLIMLPLCLMVLIAVRSDELGSAYRRRLYYGWTVVIVLGSLLLLGALINAWPVRHSKDTHIYATTNFLERSHYKFALASREVGVTTTYFGQHDTTVLPLACGSDHVLRPSILFYDEAPFTKLYSYQGNVPILLQQNQITYGTNSCSRLDVLAQFGVPKSEFSVPGVGQVMLYNPSSLHMPEVDNLLKTTTPNPKLQAKPQIGQPAVSKRTTIANLTGCDGGTVDVIVAHPDDDLLFMNPSLARQFASRCVRAVFITAGDDGRPQSYWMLREHAIGSAYAEMAGKPNDWEYRTALIAGQTVEEHLLKNDPMVDLVFLRLPDGNVNGRGFASTDYVSIEKLASRQLDSMHSIDGRTNYTYTSLIGTLGTILKLDDPEVVFTQVAGGNYSVGDHSDHRTAGKLVMLARAAVYLKVPVGLFVGYPSNGLQPNLTEEEVAQKRTIFYTYAQEDGAICETSRVCPFGATFENYLSRSYEVSDTQQLISAQ